MSIVRCSNGLRDIPECHPFADRRRDHFGDTLFKIPIRGRISIGIYDLTKRAESFFMALFKFLFQMQVKLNLLY